ncbi:response regulator [Brevundimonas sp. NPDC092305]|uniref:response regulator n=1 Tax=Brevundimonas sp. NPDC092305 TaxID=3363957 RepID=UPI003823B9B2
MTDPTPSPVDSVADLCRLYDPLLDGGAVPAAALEELGALARIFDLDATGEPALVWKNVRAVVTRQPTADPSDVEPSEVLTLLIVEDDADTAADLIAVLSEAGHRAVGPFQNVAAAEVAAALHPVDVALLDINLADDSSGIDLARSLKDRWGVPSIFLSGDVTAAARHADLAEALVSKPYTGREVLAALGRITA